MNWHLTLDELGQGLLIGAISAIVYLYLLWRTVKLLPEVKHKGLFLFVSAILRIGLLLAVMLFFSDKKTAEFLLIFVGFIITRFIVLRFSWIGGYHEDSEKQMQRAFNKGKKKKR